MSRPISMAFSALLLPVSFAASEGRSCPAPEQPQEIFGSSDLLQFSREDEVLEAPPGGVWWILHWNEEPIVAELSDGAEIVLDDIVYRSAYWIGIRVPDLAFGTTLDLAPWLRLRVLEADISDERPDELTLTTLGVERETQLRVPYCRMGVFPEFHDPYNVIRVQAEGLDATAFEFLRLDAWLLDPGEAVPDDELYRDVELVPLALTTNVLHSSSFELVLDAPSLREVHVRLTDVRDGTTSNVLSTIVPWAGVTTETCCLVSTTNCQQSSAGGASVLAVLAAWLFLLPHGLRRRRCAPARPGRSRNLAP